MNASIAPVRSLVQIRALQIPRYSQVFSFYLDTTGYSSQNYSQPNPSFLLAVKLLPMQEIISVYLVYFHGSVRDTGGPMEMIFPFQKEMMERIPAETEDDLDFEVINITDTSKSAYPPHGD